MAAGSDFGCEPSQGITRELASGHTGENRRIGAHTAFMFSAMKSIEIALAATDDAIQQAQSDSGHPGLRATLISGRVQLEAARKLARLSLAPTNEAA